jgi:hypothetical protein
MLVFGGVPGMQRFTDGTQFTVSVYSGLPHVFVLLLENLNADQAYALPYVTSLRQNYGAAYNYSAVAHPSGPNYLGLITGYPYPLDADTLDFTAASTAPNLCQQMTDAGIPWGAYIECYDPAQWNQIIRCSAGSSDLDHRPFIYVPDLQSNLAHMWDLDTHFLPLLSQPPSAVPNWCWITPASLHSGDDGTPQQADDWLATFVPQIIASPAFQQGNGTILIVWDESSDRGIPPITMPVAYTVPPAYPWGSDSGGNVGCLVIHQGMPAGAQYTEALDHYSLLRAWQRAFGLPLLGGAKTAPAFTALEAML